ncbi:MAG: PAS domain S-box protein [Candidatus Omnitrophica bacterium]|nr:PAS domain S-box protein [Candidatus Omnitrophota bacterium]
MSISNSYQFNPTAIAPLIAGLLIGLLGLLVLIREKRSVVSVAFFLLTSSAMLWLLSYLGIYCAVRAETAYQWGKIQNLGVVFIPSFLYFFSLALVKKFRRSLHFAVGSLAVSAVFFCVVLFSDAFVSGVYRYPWGYYARYGRAALFFLGFFFITLVSALHLLWTDYRLAPTPRQRKRLKVLIIAFSTGYLASIDYVPAMGMQVYPLGFLPVLGFIALAAYAIWRYHLIDITPEFAAKKIVDTMPDMLIVLDEEGTVRLVNPAAERFFGKPGWQFLGKPLESLEKNLFTAAHRATLNAKGSLSDYEIMVKRGHEERVINVSAGVMRDDGGMQVAYVLIARDVTEHQRAEEALLQKTAELAKTDAERNQLKLFALAASHDLRSPLQKIISYAELLRLKAGPTLPPEAEETLALLLKSAGRMSDLINALLRLSMVSVKEGVFEPVDLSHSVKDVMDDLELRIRNTQTDIQVGRLPVVYADKALMYELFQNLISNAIKFHPKGVAPQIRIKGSVRNGMAEITVKDNGVGFDPKDAAKLFKPFERLDARFEGSGMGLAICQKIVERHHGTISAGSKPGEGSVFTITLPQQIQNPS